MKQLTRKILALLLCAVLLLGMTACTQTPNEPTEKENEQTPTVSEDQNSENTPAASENESKPAEGNDTISFPLETPETFSMFAIVNGDVALPDCLAWQEVEAQTNVKWDIQSALGVEIEEKKNLLLNSGKYPDVFYKANLTPDQVNKYGAEGVFIALNDLIDQYCPNLKAEMAKRPGAEERITAPDGNIYSLPFLGRSGNGWINSFINQPWLDTPGCDTHQRDPNARPFFEEEYLMVWRQMEKLVEMGLVKSIGMSNMNIPKIESVWQEMKIKPVVNECELHPHLRQDELIAYLKEKNVLPIAHTPLGSPHRPERDRTTEDTNCLQDPAILEIAQAHGIHPVSVVLKWAVQRGTLPVPFSISRSHILSNLRCCTEDLLTNAEMEKINNIGTQCRLIKGTVLLWEGAPDWHCLWDEQGEIDRTGWKG